MKFGKSLSNQIEETLPEWRDKFLSYKDLKKRLKLIEPPTDSKNGALHQVKRRRLSSGAVDDSGMSREEADFIALLEEELEKFNSFFVEQEEEYIIRMKELQDRVAKANEEMLKIKKEIVDFHGEMVLLENYSALNYTGLVKILKKYDKRMGALIRLPFIQNVLKQPFFTTDVLYELVKECEGMLDQLSPTTRTTEPSIADSDEARGPTSCAATVDDLLKCPTELVGIEQMESFYMRSTISALRALKQIRSGSSTVSMFSLPPLQLTGAEETWKNIPVLEQVAK